MEFVVYNKETNEDNICNNILLDKYYAFLNEREKIYHY
jgi:hypothetical protein